MDFSENLYVGKTVKNSEEVLTQLKQGVPVTNIYLICIPKDIGSKNLMEIICSSQIVTQRFINKQYTVAALVYGKEEAFHIVKVLAEDFYNKHPDSDFTLRSV